MTEVEDEKAEAEKYLPKFRRVRVDRQGRDRLG